MAITDLTTATTAIENQLGDQDAQTLAPLIPVFWSARADKAAVVDGLQYQYTLRDCTDVLVGQLWGMVDSGLGDQKEALSQKLKGVQVIRVNAQAEIAILEARATANRAPVLMPLTSTAPVAPWTPPCIQPSIFQPSPNDPGYGGSPLIDKGVPGNTDF